MLSVVLPSYGRYVLTLTLLDDIVKQTLEDFELFFIGDCCEVYEQILKSPEFARLKLRLRDNLISFNNKERDGTSASAINYAIKYAKGDYFIFLSNDDHIQENHFEQYYTKTKESGADFGCFPTLINDGLITKTRIPELGSSAIGHSEICVKTEVAKSLPAHNKKYGHDWDFIESAIIYKKKFTIFKDYSPTYIVNALPNRERSWNCLIIHD